MQTKITLIIDAPADAVAFEAAFSGLLGQAGKLPALTRIESARVWPKEDGTPAPGHRILDLYFESYADAAHAVTTPDAGAFFGQLGEHGATFTGLFAEVETV
jgi:hypothetical protein